jgi:hypothetical protein
MPQDQAVMMWQTVSAEVAQAQLNVAVTGANEEREKLQAGDFLCG